MVGDKEIVSGRYYNANGSAVAIIAVVTEGIDWAAYIGGTQPDIPMEETQKWVAKYGCKLSEADARHYFGEDVTSLPYRP